MVALAAVVAASGAAARLFTAVVSVVAVQPLVPAVSAVAVRCSAAVDTAMPHQELAGSIISRRGGPTSIIAATSVRAITATRRPIITRAGSARWSGPITARARSAAIVRGIIATGAIAI